MPRAHFTVGEVEELIPTLEQIFMHVLQLRAGLRALGTKLDRAGVRLSRGGAGDDVGGEAFGDSLETEVGPPAVRQAKAVFRGLDEALADELERVATLGGEIKDIELGLVDFPGLRSGEEILLCWKLGEKRVSFWHSVDGGFASRRPIDEQVASAASRLD
jgi:hypothetical protein